MGLVKKGFRLILAGLLGLFYASWTFIVVALVCFFFLRTDGGATKTVEVYLPPNAEISQVNSEEAIQPAIEGPVWKVTVDQFRQIKDGETKIVIDRIGDDELKLFYTHVVEEPIHGTVEAEVSVAKSDSGQTLTKDYTVDKENQQIQVIFGRNKDLPTNYGELAFLALVSAAAGIALYRSEMIKSIRCVAG